MLLARCFRVGCFDEIGCAAGIDDPKGLVFCGWRLVASIASQVVALEDQKLMVAQCDEIVCREVLEVAERVGGAGLDLARGEDRHPTSVRTGEQKQENYQKAHLSNL